MKFKGQTVRGPLRQYSLRQQLGEGGFSVIYNTSDPQTICKVQVLSNPDIYQAYKNQKQALQQLQHKNIVDLKDSFELKEKDGYFGFLFLENCNAGNAWNILDSHGQNDVPQKLVLKIGYSVASALEFMHKKNIVHRDIKLENVLVNSRNEYKICDFGSSSKEVITMITKENREDIQQYIEKTTTPLYRSPQQLDLYAGYEISTKVDVFALGVLMFMLCFKKQPFESRLSAINKQYFVPEQTSYSSELISLIQKCFTTNPIERITASEVKRSIQTLIDRKVAQMEINLQKQLQITSSEILKITNQMLKKNTTVAESSIFDKIKLMYNQITTQTEGWIASFVQDNEQAPQLKYNRSIISKCWEKRYKVEKMYQILFKYSDDYKTKSLVNLKLLILVHNFLRKGPSESINYDGKFSVPKLSVKIYKNWKMSQRATDPEDIKRNSYVCLLIRYYSLILAAKWKLCFQNSDLIEGNFSILPFFQSKKEVALLKLPLISDIISFLDMCTEFHEILATRSYLVEIQRSIILSLVDEEYCCISLLVFLLSSFKEAVRHVSDELDIQKLSQTLKYIEKDFQNVFKKLSKLFESVKKLASLFEEQTIFSLSPKILEKIKAINIRQKKPGPFEFKKYINYERSIEGLKIPLSYEEAVKNPNFLRDLEKRNDDNVVQMHQFRISKNSEPSQSKKEPLNQAPSTSNENNQIPPNEAFKKNKQSKYGINEAFTQTKISSAKDIKLDESHLMKKTGVVTFQGERPVEKSGQIEMMEFTHQNLNKDMNSKIKDPESESRQNDQFSDFLSIVNEKFSKAQSGLSKQEASNEQIAKDEKNPQINELFNSFTNIADDTKSKISSVNSRNMWSKNVGENNIFSWAFNTVGGKTQDKGFQAFSTIVGNQKSIKNSSPMNQKEKREAPQVANLIESGEVKPQCNTVYSSISEISKQVYNSLNSTVQEEKKVELMNFFEDDEEKPSQNEKKFEQKFSSLGQIPNDLNLLSKTGPDCILQLNPGIQPLNQQNKNNIAAQTSERFLEAVNFDNDERHFKTMPSQHSFIDLKGFIVEEVKKNADQYFIEFSALKFYKKVGFGHSSEVFKGEWRGREVAIKCIKDNMSRSNAKQFKREIMTSVKIRHHPNLVTLIGIAEYQNEYYIINEFCNGATLFDFLHESNYILSIRVKLSIAKQIARGMLFLHTNDPPIIHRDLKSLNVLLVNKYNGEPQPQIKIADFGLSRDFASTYMTGTLGTYHWMAPEIFNNEPYSLKADVYSYGIVLWEILSRSPPYTNIKNPQSLMKFITLENGRPDLSLVCQECPADVKSLMIRCWDKLPEYRPTFKEILDTLNRFN